MLQYALHDLTYFESSGRPIFLCILSHLSSSAHLTKQVSRTLHECQAEHVQPVKFALFLRFVYGLKLRYSNGMSRFGIQSELT